MGVGMVRCNMRIRRFKHCGSIQEAERGAESQHRCGPDGKLVQPICRLRHSTQIHTRWRSEQSGEDTGRNDSGAIAKIGSGRGCILGGRGTRGRASCRGGRRRRGCAGSSGGGGRRSRRGGVVATAGLELSRVQSAAVVLDVGDASVLACLVSNVLKIAVGESLLADEL